MPRSSYVFLCLCLGLGACASAAVQSNSEWTAPTITGVLPSPSEPQDAKGGAPENTVLPLGVGLTTSPSAFMVGATLDFPVDTQLTFGPSLQYGFDDDIRLATLTGQLKYFLASSTSDSSSFSVLPYLTGGAGVASLDREGRAHDSGVVLNAGAGVRFLTGEHYRIGSEARLNILPDKLDGERSFFSFELLQVIVSF